MIAVQNQPQPSKESQRNRGERRSNLFSRLVPFIRKIQRLARPGRQDCGLTHFQLDWVCSNLKEPFIFGSRCGQSEPMCLIHLHIDHEKKKAMKEALSYTSGEKICNLVQTYPFLPKNLLVHFMGGNAFWFLKSCSSCFLLHINKAQVSPASIRRQPECCPVISSPGMLIKYPRAHIWQVIKHRVNEDSKLLTCSSHQKKPQ